MNKLTIEDVELNGKRVLMRVDFNVPLEDGKVSNDKRIQAALPTIEHIVEKGGRIILMSHLGRPKGERVPEMSLKPCVPVLSALLGKAVGFVEDCIGAEVVAAVAKLRDGDVLLLENLRYYREETENDPEFSAELAKLGDIYMNDAFGTNLVYESISVEDYLNERQAELGEFLGTVISGIYAGIRNGSMDVVSDFDNAAGRPHISWQDYFAQFKI